MSNSMDDYIQVGIDIGTTKCCICVVDQNRKLRVLEVDMTRLDYKELLPSYVAFVQDKVIVGEVVKKMTQTSNVLYDPKRLFGLVLDYIPKDEKKSFTFDIEQKDNHIVYMVDMGNENIELEPFRPEEVTAFLVQRLLGKLEEIPEYRNKKKKYVVTHPASFQDTQMIATEMVMHLVGITTFKFLSEPVAALLSMKTKMSDIKVDENVVVIDVGGGTLDVTICSLKNSGYYECEACNGDFSVGGNAVDRAVSELIIAKTANIEEYSTYFSEPKRALITEKLAYQKKKVRLRAESERVKILLSSKEVVEVNLSFLFDSTVGYVMKIKRDEMNEKCSDLFEKYRACIRQTLNKGNINSRTIKRVIMTGGASYMQALQNQAKLIFKEATITVVDTPELAVVKGASMFHQGDIQNVFNHSNEDIRVEIGSKCEVIVSKTDLLPAEGTKKVMTVVDGQKKAVFKIYKGDNSQADFNTFVGEFVFDKLPPQKAGDVIFILTVGVDTVGNIEAKAQMIGGRTESTIATVSFEKDEEDFTNTKRHFDAFK
ncbi:heat shock 70 kDa protein, putative [Entamoeba invadens IP1]|uniref:Heat shock 70 kDa protein, putative n=1 Tax=Entamoeba invadens IP1 TaxID=370355 RepID=A0A0A1TZE9_ENTIV|nr:heat shock 70 kDa protein, putative [Entamoeba invadens IP1]ELP86970.1 heat shock 70 kDa protein, putative [Entamoeba invadens IP1]|eukprot:XP_004253741.1 heat shock 70 kDa protein, putative [Entamoeba invadens IP1]